MFHQYQPDPFDFGLCSGLIPVVGDVVDTSLSYFLIIRPARKCDIPVLLLERMLLSSFLTQIFLRASLLLLTLCSLSFLLYVRGNSDQAVSTSIGLVPLVGDIIVASVLAPYLNFFFCLEFGSFFSSIVLVLIRVWKVNSRNAALFEDFLVARGKANLDQTTVTTAAVSTDETARLISDSTKPGYIDGKTGERSDQSTSGAGLTSQAGPSTQLSAASAPIIESTVSDSDLKPADKRRSRWWFSRKTEGKDS